jgi:hypothetical protein
MKKEFPPDEQLPMEKMLQRVANPVEHDGNARRVVNVVQDMGENRGFMIYNICQTKSGPFAIVEYLASVGAENKRQRYGKMLADDAKKTLLSQGVEQMVIETEMVPRIIGNPVHDDIIAFGQTYTRIGDLWVITKGIARWSDLDQRDHFWGEMGFGIAPDVAYCQPDLVNGIKERRVPLDLQIADIKMGASLQIPVSRVKDIMMAIAEYNYNLGSSSGPLVQTESAMAYSGRNLSDGSVSHLEVVPYRQLLQRPEIEHAMKMHCLHSRYK